MLGPMPAHAIRCPKCGDGMPSRKRNGVVIEQCVSCHGIYLDPGELERLLANESSALPRPERPTGPISDGRPPGSDSIGRLRTGS